MLSTSARSPTSPSGPSSGTKRPYAADEAAPSPANQQDPHRQAPGARAGPRRSVTDVSPPATSSNNAPPSSSSSNSYSPFRNVSACNRCRLRKNRCDQRLPRCQSCEKARVHCVGYDPTTKREIPRSYVFFLESRVAYLEKVLVDNGVEFRAAEAYEGELDLDKPVETGPSPDEPTNNGDGGAVKPLNSRTGSRVLAKAGVNGRASISKVKKEKDGHDQGSATHSQPKTGAEGSLDQDNVQEQQTEEAERRIDSLVSNIGMVSVQGASDPRYLGSTSGISFARVVFAAVKSSVASNSSDRSGVKPSERQPGGPGTNAVGSSMRDSYFGLQARPSMKQAPFPDREVAERLVNLYFEHANPQMPILHRGDFNELFERVYSNDFRHQSSRDLYMLNIVCAIGAGIIFDAKSDVHPQEEESHRTRNGSPTSQNQKRQRLSGQQHQPEEYHASAVVHLESMLGSSPITDGFGGGLDELQSVLLLASFALLRPVAPGLWYIVGVAVRLAIDLGLHYEDGTGIDSIGEHDRLGRRLKPEEDPLDGKTRIRLRIDPRERGRREWVRDLRRRLWWCVYSIDRLVSTCVGRPFGVTDQVITTEFPSLLDDKYITKTGFVNSPSENTPSYKHVGHHYLKLRLLQSEIQQVLQYQQAKLVRSIGKNRSNAFMHTNLPSPFLHNFDSFSSWRKDVHRRLYEWKESAPTRQQTGVRFPVEFLELNYWQALVMLYRQSLTVPAPLAKEISPTDDVSSPSLSNVEEGEDEDDIYLKVAEAGQKVLKLYRQLHRVRLVNYTYLATHHLFMAGIAFLYAIWHSPAVRSRLTLDDVDFTILAATSVLGDLMEKCPPAEACRDAFDRMSQATVKMCLSTTGFGSSANTTESRPIAPPIQRPTAGSNVASKDTSIGEAQQTTSAEISSQDGAPRFAPKFDMGLHDLFPEGFHEAERRPHRPRARSDRPHRGEMQSNQHPPDQYQNQSPFPSQQLSHERQQEPAQQPQSDQSQQQDQPFYSDTYSEDTTTQQQQQPYTSPRTAQNDFLSLSDLRFLDMVPNPEPFQMYDPSTGSDGDRNGDVDMLSLPSFGQDGSGATGLDLGFGMAVDFQHDWSEGAGYDLFDGYFFGGAGGNGGA